VVKFGALTGLFQIPYCVVKAHAIEADKKIVIAFFQASDWLYLLIIILITSLTQARFAFDWIFIFQQLVKSFNGVVFLLVIIAKNRRQAALFSPPEETPQETVEDQSDHQTYQTQIRLDGIPKPETILNAPVFRPKLENFDVAVNGKTTSIIQSADLREKKSTSSRIDDIFGLLNQEDTSKPSNEACIDQATARHIENADHKVALLPIKVMVLEASSDKAASDSAKAIGDQILSPKSD